MDILLNGKKRAVSDGITISELLIGLGLQKEEVAVERNLHVVLKNEYENMLLAEGDRVEIVRFVGGG